MSFWLFSRENVHKASMYPPFTHRHTHMCVHMQYNKATSSMDSNTREIRLIQHGFNSIDLGKGWCTWSCGCSQSQTPLVSMFTFILMIIITALWAASDEAKSRVCVGSNSKPLGVVRQEVYNPKKDCERPFCNSFDTGLKSCEQTGLNYSVFTWQPDQLFMLYINSLQFLVRRVQRDAVGNPTSTVSFISVISGFKDKVPSEERHVKVTSL